MKLQFAIAAMLAFAHGAGASAQSPSLEPARDPAAPAGAGIDVRTTLTPWTSGPLPCGDTSVLNVQPGSQVAVCYTVTNRSGRALDWHYLADSVLGDDRFYDRLLHEPLPDGASLTFKTMTGTLWRSVDLRSTWTSAAAPPSDYAYAAAAFAYVDLSTSSTATRIMSLDGSAPSSIGVDVRMPFAFRFYELPAVDVLCVGFRGVIFVGQPGCRPPAGDNNFGKLPIGFQHNLIAPAWTNYNSTLSGGSVYVDTQGVAPNRRFIVEWRGMTRDVPGPGITFEAIIEEGSGAITFQYASMAFNDDMGSEGDYGANSTVGIQRSYGANGNAPIFTQYSWWQPVLTDGKAIRWTLPPAPPSATATDVAHIEILAPQIAVGPEAIAASVPSGGSAQSLVTIANRGNADLAWSLGERPTRTGFRFDTPYVTTLRAPGAVASAAERRRAAAAATVPMSPLRRGAAAIPAYAIAYYGDVRAAFATLDAAAPGALTDVNANVFGGGAIQVGGFVDNDFSREYLLQNGGCNADLCWPYEYQYLLTRDGAGTSGSTGITVTPYAAAGADWHGLKWDATSQTLYAVASTPAPPSRTDLYTIDARLGTPMWVGRLDDVSDYGTKLLDIAIAPNGDMYGIDEYTDTLVAIDKRSGHVRPVGPTGLDAGDYDVQAMDFDASTGTLYYAAYPLTPTVTGMYTVDLGTGHATLVGPIGDGATALRAFSIAIPGGPCADPHDVAWLSFERTNGTTAAGAYTPVAVTLDAAGLSDGIHRAKVCVESNAPFRSVVAVPVTFTVGDGERLFSSGFETP